VSEILTKVSERDTLFAFYERMFMFAEPVTHRKCAACFFLSGRGEDRDHGGHYTAPETGFAVPLADDEKYFLGAKRAKGRLEIEWRVSLIFPTFEGSTAGVGSGHHMGVGETVAETPQA
jgi:hypothetical protein